MADVMRMEKHSGKPLKRASPYRHASDMLDVVSVNPYERRAGAHAHDDHPAEPAAELRAESIRQKLVRTRCRKTVETALDIGAAHSGEHDLLDILEIYLIIINIFAESSEQGSYRISGRDELGRLHFAVLDSHYLRGTSAHVYSYDHNSILYFPPSIPGIRLNPAISELSVLVGVFDGLIQIRRIPAVETCSAHVLPMPRPEQRIFREKRERICAYGLTGLID